MDCSEHNLNGVANLLSQTLQGNNEQRTKASDFLRGTERQQGYSIVLLRIISLPQYGVNVHLAAAAALKNLIKKFWVQSEDEDFALTEADKDQLKNEVVGVMLSAPHNVRRLLASALTIISESDFPAKWPALLPQLVGGLQSGDAKVVVGSLHSIHGITKRYRSAMRSDTLFLEIIEVLKQVHDPLLALFEQMSKALPESASVGAAHTNQILATLTHCVKIFYSLNAQDLPEVIEDNLSKWLMHFHSFLAPPSSIQELCGEGMRKLQSAACEAIQLFMSRYEDEFKEFLPTFAQDVWSLLVQHVGGREEFDRLACAGIDFLSCVAKSNQHSLFEQPGVLQPIVEQIVLPSLFSRDDDEILLEDNPTEFIHRDLEGADSDTRRRSACELIKALCVYYEAPASQMFLQYSQTQMGRYASNPAAQWRDKEAAIVLMIALGAKGTLQQQGVVEINPHVSVEQFYFQHVLPGLARAAATPVDAAVLENIIARAGGQDATAAAGVGPAAVNLPPLLTSALLKYVITFRNQIPPESLPLLLAVLISLINSSEYIVHTYAAICLERLLMVKDAQRQPRLGKETVAAAVVPLVTALVGRFTLPCSRENEHVMRTLMRVVITAGDGMQNHAQGMLQTLTSVLAATAEDGPNAPTPQNPVFYYHLFETLAAVIRRNTAFDDLLWPTFSLLLQKEKVSEWHAYVYQVMALIIERSANSDPARVALFESLLRVEHWQNRNNAPALARLVSAFVEKLPQQLMEDGARRLQSTLGVSQYLVGSRALDLEGIRILRSVVQAVPAAQLQPYFIPIVGMLFARVTQGNTPKFSRGLVGFFGVLGQVVGPDTLVQIVQMACGNDKNAFANMFQAIWLPNLQFVPGKIEAKTAKIVTIRLATESAQFLSEPTVQCWPKTIAALLPILAAEGQGAANNAVDEMEEIVQNFDNSPGFTSGYSPLHNAAKSANDPNAQIASLRSFAAQSLRQVQSTNPAVAQLVASLSQEEQTQYHQLISSA